jgi:NAD(P)-dependent dehydrogenase (short-subunit alcohol dehydrogenase family)
MNNAYFTVMGTATEIRESDWDRSVSILLKAPFIACQEAIPLMADTGGGSIINVSSVHGYLASNRFHVYDTAKAGLINMTRSVALDYGRKGIRANAICPGFISTERSQARFLEQPELARRAALVYPIGRFGQPIDIANAAVFLASDESSFVTGTTLTVDGGMTCQLPDTLYDAFAQYHGGK